MENIETTDSKMNDVLELQKDYFIKNGPPSLELRIDRLNRLKNLILNNKLKIIHKKELKEDPLNRRPDIKLAQKLFNWDPKTTISNGLDRTINYFLNNKA